MYGANRRKKKQRIARDDGEQMNDMQINLIKYVSYFLSLSNIADERRWKLQ